MALKAEEVYAILKRQIQSGGATPEQIQQAVDAYLEENPVQPGATVEQAAQIEQNKTDIQKLNKNGSINEEKLSDNLKLKTIKDYITIEMFNGKGDGISDDSQAFKDAILYAKQNKIKEIRLLSKTYLINDGFEIDFPVLITGISPKITCIKSSNDFLGEYIFNFTILKNGGGVKNIQIIGNKTMDGIVLTGESEETVNAGFIISDIVLNNFKNGIKILRGWQTTIRDMYVSGCSEVGVLIEGADNTLHDINISYCTCGLKVKAGTNKIVNIKIDNCITEENGYACDMTNERGSVYGLEVQYCAPNGIRFSGNFMTCHGIVVDRIGQLVNGEINDVGNGIAFGYSEYSTYDIKYRGYGNTKMLAYDNAGTINNNIRSIYEVTKKSDILIYSENKSIFTKEQPIKYKMSNSLLDLIKIGALSSPVNENNFEYDSSIKIEINNDTVPDIGEYKAIYYEVKLETTGTLSTSIYKGEESVVEYTLHYPNGVYSILKDGTSDFTIYFSSTEKIKLYSVEIILYKNIAKMIDI